jgi:hypothetical protein
MQYYPSKAETRACGSLGISIFLFIFSLSFYSLLNRFKNIETKSFYILTMIMSIFEFPRYFSMVVVGDYNSVDCYASHIIADLLYFLCLAAVILTFTSILELGPYASAIYSKRGLFLAAICQATINFTAVIYCVHSSSLMSFFSSLLYELFTCFDFIQNFLYTSVIALHGAQLINRFVLLLSKISHYYLFSIFFRFQNLNDYATSAFEKEVFKGLVIKLTRILLVVSLFTLSRLAILLLKVSSRYSPKPVTTVLFCFLPSYPTLLTFYSYISSPYLLIMD